MAVELQAISAGNSPAFNIDTEVMFSDRKGHYKKRIEKRQRKLLKYLPDLDRFLTQDEKVLLVTTGCSPMGFLEWYVTGWVIYYIKRSLFVVTNKRIFHIPTTRSYQYRNSIAEIRYADCRSIEIRGSHLKVEYKSGEKESFGYIARSERGKIKELLGKLSYEGQPSALPVRKHLCPRCTAILEPDNFTCPSCRLQFKSISEGRNISIIFPGGGYFYTGHPLLGISDAIVEIILILLVVSAIVDLLNGVPDSGGMLAVAGLFLVFEKIVSVYHANHFIEEYIPKDKNITPVPGT